MTLVLTHFSFFFRALNKHQHPRNSLKLLGLSIATIVLFGLSHTGLSQTDSSYEARFDQAWRLVSERYWNIDADFWQSVRDEFEADALAARNNREFYRVLEDMYERIGDNHSVFVPPERVAEIREDFGDLPCLGIFSWSAVGLQANELASLENYPSGVEAGLLSLETTQQVGYIDVPNLATTGTARDMRRAVEQFSPTANAFIVDLRGNPGGRLVEMMQAAGIFVNGFLWRTITSWTLPLPYPALGLAITDAPLVMLIDADVNSAAEGLAGGLQANGRATVIGQTSAGNVEAVLPFCLRDGSQAWIATGVLAPLQGATWEGTGVVPDVPTNPDDALDAALKYLAETL
ncbi:MAG: S41 family peptidase [Deinococcota bacterium]